MNRRGHLSHKIPNVKLRPAPIASTSTGRKGKKRSISPDSEIWREQYAGGGSDGDDDGDIMMDGSKKPWEGIVITFTGVDDKV